MNQYLASHEVTIKLSSSSMKFAAGHFTIFSATERENLHGHNFNVSCLLTSRVGEEGMICDYKIFKEQLSLICSSLDELLLLPLHSPYLKVVEKDDSYLCLFYNEKLTFLKRDVKILPIQNATIENLVWWILDTFLIQVNINNYLVEKVAIELSSSSSQLARATWRKQLRCISIKLNKGGEE